MNQIWMRLKLFGHSLPERYKAEVRRHRLEDNSRAYPLLVICCLGIAVVLALRQLVSPVSYARGPAGSWYMAVYLIMILGAAANVPLIALLPRMPSRASTLIVGAFNFFVLNWTAALSFIDIKVRQGYDAIVLGALAFAVLYRTSARMYAAALAWLIAVGIAVRFTLYANDIASSHLVPYFIYALAAFAVSLVLESDRLETAMLRADLRRTNEELRELSMHDPLTGLYNRYYLNEFLSKQIPFARRQKQCISLLIMDLDRFKEINDRFGHPAGDQVLSQLAQRLKESVREYDLLFRYGGEEFLVVLLNTNREDACIVAERIRANVENDDFQLEDRKVTVSIGIASIPEDGELDAALKTADDRLYAAKAAGRNRCVSA